MSFISRMKSIFFSNVGLGKPSQYQQEWGWLDSSEYISGSTTRAPKQKIDFLKQYKGWVHHCVNRNAEQLASSLSKLHLYAVLPPEEIVTFKSKKVNHIQKKEIDSRRIVEANAYSEVMEHPVLDLLYKPNPLLTGYELFKVCDIYISLVGSAFIYKQKEGNTITGLWSLYPLNMQLVMSDDQLVGYKYWVDKENFIPYMPEEIIHLKNIDPMNPYGGGRGPIESEAAMILLGDMIDDYENNMMKNHAVPPLYLYSPVQLDPKQMKNLHREWHAAWGGTKNAGKVPVLSGGVEPKQLAFSPKDVSYLQGEDKVMLRIANALGIPKPFLTTDDVNLANSEQANKQYAQFTLFPKLKYLELKLTEELAAEFDDRLFFMFDNPIPDDRAQTLQETVAYVNQGILTVNEARTQLNLPPVEGGDLMPWERGNTNEPLFGLPPTAEDEDRTPSPLKPRLPAAGEDTTGDTEPEEEDDEEPKWFSPSKKVKSAPAKKALNRKEFRKDIYRYFMRQVKAILPLLRKSVKNVDNASTAMQQYRSVWDDEAKKLTEPYIKNWSLKGGEKSLSLLAQYTDRVEDIVASTFDVFNKEVTEWVDDYTFKFAKAINDETESIVRDTIKYGTETGLSNDQISNLLSDKMDTMSKMRADRIARTESTRAMTHGQKEMLKATKLVKSLVWRASPDCCDFCQAIDGKTVGVEEDFFKRGDVIEAGGNKLSINYENVGVPPCHVNCRCSVDPVLHEDISNE